MPALTTSVTIACFSFERFQATRAAIASAFEQSRPPDEVIVAVDHNPPLLEALRAAVPSSVRFTLNDGLRGCAPTRNAAVRAASGDLIVTLDDDATAAHDWLENLTAPFSDPRVMVVGGRALPVWPGDVRPSWFPAEYEFAIGCTGYLDLLSPGGGEVRNVAGVTTAIRRSAFERVGLWQERLGRGQTATGGEEAELCLRIKSLIPGARVIYQPQALVHHQVLPERATLRYVTRYAYNEGRVRRLVKQFAAEHTDGSLGGEMLFLRRLLTHSVPRRLLRIARPGAAAQLGMIGLLTGLVLAGYAQSFIVPPRRPASTGGRVATPQEIGN